MEDIFGKAGYLSRAHSNYEFRGEQLQMAEFIMERLLDKENALIEAGTGIGKTLAYLIPAILYSLENQKIVAVSTETKALQKQLIDKDIRLARKVVREYTGKDFKHSLCLGSSNYPCRKRFEALILRGGFEPGDQDAVEALANAFAGKGVFSRFDFSVPNQLWEEIHRESEACNSHRCPFSSKCIYQRAKKEWQSSNLLIMNHYLFFSNISAGKAYLPKFDIVIFDEAHSIEEIASDQLGFDESYNRIIETLQNVYKRSRKSSIVNRISGEKERKRAVETVNAVSKEINLFFEKLRDFFKDDSNTFRLREALPFGEIPVKHLKDLLVIFEKVQDDFSEDTMNIDFEIARGKLFAFLQSLESLIYLQNSNFVYWIEKNGEEMLGDIHLMGKPVDVSQPMYQEINSFYDSCIFVSAALTAKREFSFIADRLGIFDYKPLLLNSPFDYKNQVILYLEKNSAGPDDTGFIDKAAEISSGIIGLVGGNCLMLFTSYKMLDIIRRKLASITRNTIYAQSDFSAVETVERYIKDDGSVLMGTHSFWQGIDLPGDLLRGVIMMRLPFSVPDRPVTQARIERLEERGLNPFSSYQIPSAVIKFKQGFGRLIRSKEDRGIVAVLDPRILSKGYGKMFLESLPECRIVYSLKELKETFSSLVA
ncbi:MAG: DEAD/DEAH box helicase [Spirochaetes bacterium]|nr:DEAD/DEAH box helicase [Spirochaetota bacterium]